MAQEIRRADDGAFNLRAETLANIANSTPFDFKGMAGGQVHIPPGQTGLNLLTWYASHDGATYVPAKWRGTEAVVDLPVDGVNGGSYPLPDDLFACHRLKAVGNVACTYHVTMKG